jgi:tRNA nucleotidyltransferase/poly(A) polymerase
MTTAPTSLADASWLAAHAVKSVFAALDGDGDETRVVGGAVRNALMGIPVVDVDFATTATPDIVARRAEAAGFKVVPTGIEHGTLTVVAGGHGYEVTTLREDIETDGRHAIVRFGRDWLADAGRRDFTVNALSVDATGTVYDPLAGYDDIVARRIRFIGDPGQRIVEDRLRILRFFRFYAQYGKGDLDRDGLSASIRARDGLRELSAERIGQEMRRLAGAPGAVETLTVMQDSGIAPIVLGGVAYIGPLRRMAVFEAANGLAPVVALRLAALGCRIEEDVLRLAERFRLANTERDRMLRAVAAINGLLSGPTENIARRRLYLLGEEPYRDGVVLAFAWGGATPDDPAWRELFGLPDRWKAPAFPLGGRDVLSATALRGPSIGAVLKALEAWWIESDFSVDEPALRARLQQMAQAAQ